MSAASIHQNDRLGLLYAAAGFALLSFGDAVVKTMVDEWPPTAIAALRYSLGAAGLSALLLASEGRGAFAGFLQPIQWLRGASVAIATICFFGSLLVMPLDEATTIVFVAPMLVALFAPVFLGEKSRRESWIASGAAFVGVLIVLRPNLAEIGWAAFLPLVAATGMSILMIANRAVAGRSSALSMQAFVALAAAPVIVTVAIVAHFTVDVLRVGTPDWTVIARCAFVAVSASSAHWLVYLGTTRAGAATIAPMTYIQLVVAVLLGWWWFGDVPDLATLAGATIIIGAGLYLWHRGRAAPIPAGRQAVVERTQD
ncbi:Riboflavin transporter [Alteripontixanthobacter maritimus]|uniref:Riboflavin transporter n=1 Tax=Alteripontixanthobacter maritimus TaxID=2161824 RepID=A0A369QEN0_9SPHN|nr:DMT family transporter [Alteripontixanthobacter maritimus]RDC60748.1 Riboflavin transporter [Alteripontixanthobacter maritimus]